LKVNYVRVLGVEVEESGVGRAISTFTPSEEAEFLEMARSGDVYEKIVRSIAPAIQGEYTVGM
jgi:DNA replicative helicase MCM subunit Mcm2 (Cdc46/Mcm family)